METHFPQFYIEHLNHRYQCSQLMPCGVGEVLRERVFEIWKHGEDERPTKKYVLNRGLKESEPSVI